MRGTKRGRLPRYIITLLRFISTFTIPSLILSQFLSLLDELLRLTVHGYYCASSPGTLSPILCFCFCLSSIRSHMRNHFLLSLKLISFIRSCNRTSFKTRLRTQEKNVGSNQVLASYIENCPSFR